MQPHLNGLPVEIANSGWRDYGNRAGCDRLLNILNEVGVPASAVVNSDVVDAEPDLFKRLVSLKRKEGRACWLDILGHGKNNSLGMAGKSFEEEMSDTQQILRTLSQGVAQARGEGEKPAQRIPGWLSPGFSVTLDTPRVLAMNGVASMMDATDDDVVYQLAWGVDKEEEGGGSIVVVPYSMETNDISLCLSRNFTGREYGDTLIDHVTQLCRESSRRTSPSPVVVCWGLHTFIAGTPAKALHFKRAIETLQQELPDDVWWCNASMLLDHLRVSNTNIL